MKKTTNLLIVALVLIIAACSKDQKVVKQLEGTWKVTSAKHNGVAEPDSVYSGTRYTFESCKVKKGDCAGTVSEDGKSFPFTYNISEKGTKMTVTMLGVSSTSDILEHSKSKFVWKTTDGSDVDETTIEKI